MITPNQLEAACAAWWDRGASVKWANIPEAWKQFYRDNMLAALEAALVTK